MDGTSQIQVDFFPLAIIMEEIKPVYLLSSGKAVKGSEWGRRMECTDAWVVLDFSFISQKAEPCLSKISRDECLEFQSSKCYLKKEKSKWIKGKEIKF